MQNDILFRMHGVVFVDNLTREVVYQLKDPVTCEVYERRHDYPMSPSFSGIDQRMSMRLANHFRGDLANEWPCYPDLAEKHHG